MLGLRLGFQQVAIAYEILDGADVVVQLFGKRQRTAYQTRDTLPQGVVESLNVIGLACFFADRTVLCSGDDAFIHHIRVRIKRRLMTLCLGYLAPELLGAFAAAVADVKSNDLSRFDSHGQPNPLLVGLLLNEAGHLVSFHFETLDHHVLVTRDRLDIQMVRQGLETGDDKAQ